jgi:hypothetical protein
MYRDALSWSNLHFALSFSASEGSDALDPTEDV